MQRTRLRRVTRQAGPFGPQEQRDNYDLIEWLARQPWSTGKVGQSGVSYGRHAALLVAVNKPPHLEAIIPVNGISDWYENTIYRGGIYSARIREWQREVAPDTLTSYARHPLYDDFWLARSVKSRWEHLDVPVLEINGWYDRYRDGMVANYQARPENVWMVSGPWEHGMPAGQYADVGNGMYLAWWDHWLRGVPEAPLPEARVTSYEIPGPGAGAGWQQVEAWPPPKAGEATLALTAGGGLAAEPGRPATPTYQVNTDPGAGEPGQRLTFQTPPLDDDVVLAAGLVDHLHVVVVPILLGRGVRLLGGLEGLEKDYQVEVTSSPSGVTHMTFTRVGV